jgi:hypothetical protein
MTKQLLRIVVASGLALLCGCASSRLELTMDIYAQNPRDLIPWTPTEIQEAYAGLNQIEIASREIEQDRITLANDLMTTYLAIHKVSVVAAGFSTDSPAVKQQEDILNAHLADFNSQVRAKATEVRTLATTARGLLDSYVEKRNQESGLDLQVAQSAARAALDDVRVALLQLGSGLNTDFENFLVANWDVVAQSIPDEQAAIPDQDLSGLIQAAQKLRQTLAEQSERGFGAEKAVDQFGRAVDNLSSEAVGLTASVARVARAASSIPAGGLGETGRTGLISLAQSTGDYFSQIDRLQDPADPVWRVISDPENESLWHESFVETYYYAEGNSEVVVARDTPISFRVQRGTNDPTALVQSQLQVTRALSSAALTVAKAATGVPIPSTVSDGSKTGVEVADDDRLATRRAVVDEKKVLRQRTLANLRRNLERLRTEYEALDPDPAANVSQKGALAARMQAVIDSSLLIFSTSD